MKNLSLTAVMTASFLFPAMAQEPSDPRDPAATSDEATSATASAPAPRAWSGAVVTTWWGATERAADEIEAALDGEGDLRRAVAAAVIALGETRTADRLEGALTEREEDAFAAECERIVADLRFRPYVEAERPLGFPEPAPVGEVVLKSYPRYRMARTEMAARGGTSGSFWRLFQHIKKNEIAMTAPVQIDYEAKDTEARRTESMAFLYSHPNMGEAGTDQQVDVVDVEPMLTISIGGRGYESREQLAAMRAILEEWLARNGDRFEAAGPMRTMGYNSPMVAASRRFYEVEIPVRMR